MPPTETCIKHDDCLGRIHTELNSINTGNAELKGKIVSFIEELRAFKNKAEDDLYNPEKGLASKVNAHATQLSLQWGVLGTIVGGIIVGVTVGYVRIH